MNTAIRKKYENLSENELSVLLGALNVYVRIEDLPEDIKQTAENLRAEVKRVVKKQW